MPKKVPDLAGQKFNMLTAIRSIGKKRNGEIVWECRCECGNTSTVPSWALRNKRISCGCAIAKSNLKRFTKHDQSSHEKRTKMYMRWSNMNSRCNNKNNKGYKNYGGRGISVCEEWRDFNNFIAWVNNSDFEEGKGLELDRIDNDKGYSPDNCRWVTGAVNATNKRTNRIIKIGDEEKLVSQWSRETGICRTTIIRRIEKGWPEKDWLKKPEKYRRGRIPEKDKK